jgi:hypothetical protein
MITQSCVRSGRRDMPHRTIQRPLIDDMIPGRHGFAAPKQLIVDRK